MGFKQLYWVLALDSGVGCRHGIKASAGLVDVSNANGQWWDGQRAKLQDCVAHARTYALLPRPLSAAVRARACAGMCLELWSTLSLARKEARYHAGTQV